MFNLTPTQVCETDHPKLKLDNMNPFPRAMH